MRIAIIEDQTAEAEALQQKTEEFLPEDCNLSDIDIFPSGKAFLQANRFYDLLFIDCLLPDMSGIELAKKVRETNRGSSFIFTTAYMEYASEGYETDALRYLLKPINDEKLQEALNQFLLRTKQSPILELTGTNRHSVFAQTSKILYVEYVNRRTVVRLENRSVETQRSIAQFEALLGRKNFFRTSRRFLVNFQYITEKAQNILIMRNGEHVTVSRRKTVAFNQAYIEYLKQN